MVALASGRAVAGPVTWGERAERALVGLPVQQIESLLREATPGEILMSREVHDELKGAFEAAGYRLAPRRGVITPQPLYVIGAQMASQLTGGTSGSGAQAVTLTQPGAATLTGISPGALLGARFEILSVLGAGGMGIVYKARDRELDDLVALKMLKRDLWGDRNQLDRLKSELKLARKITHPNVLRTYDFGEMDGIPFISMEFVRGVTLRYMLDQTRRLPYSAGLRLAKQLCAGLARRPLGRRAPPRHQAGEPDPRSHRQRQADGLRHRPADRPHGAGPDPGRLHRRHAAVPGAGDPAGSGGRPPGRHLRLRHRALRDLRRRAAVRGRRRRWRSWSSRCGRSRPPPSTRWREIPPALEAAILRCLKKDPGAALPRRRGAAERP